MSQGSQSSGQLDESSVPLSPPLPRTRSAQHHSLTSTPLTASSGLDNNIIPADVLRQAKGLAFLTVTKAGFLFSVRAGSGLVIARLADGSWSAPSAIGTAGVGAGLMAGAEMAEFFIVLK